MRSVILILFLLFTSTIFCQTEFGIVCGSCPDKIAAAKAVNVSWLRVQVSLNNYRGQNILQKYYNSGLNIIATVKWSTGIDSFNVDTNKYRMMLDSFVKHNISPDKQLFLVIGNEPLNPSGNYGSANDYVNIMKAGVEIASKYGLNISDGGLTFSILKLKVFVSMMDSHKWDNAYEFAATCIPEETVQHLQNPLYNNWSDMRFLDTVVTGIFKITYPYFFSNFHYYAPALYQRTPDSIIVDSISSDKFSILSTTVEWLKANTGKQVICNEMGQFNTNPKLLQSMLHNVERLGLPLLIWKAGDDGDSKGLFNSNLVLRANGVVFKKFIL